jgi:hypothetical protein
MKRFWLLVALLLALSAPQLAAAEQRFIVRTNLGLPPLQQLCLFHLCSVVRCFERSSRKETLCNEKVIALLLIQGSDLGD